MKYYDNLLDKFFIIIKCYDNPDITLTYEKCSTQKNLHDQNLYPIKPDQVYNQEIQYVLPSFRPKNEKKGR